MDKEFTLKSLVESGCSNVKNILLANSNYKS